MVPLAYALGVCPPVDDIVLRVGWGGGKWDLQPLKVINWP